MNRFTPPSVPPHLAGPMPAFGPEDRRQRRRRPTRVPGWAYHGQQAGRVDEVRVRNASPDGAGFVSERAFVRGQPLYLKIGLGPQRLPRPAEVSHVRRRADGTYEVGVRFVAPAVNAKSAAA